MAEFIAHWLSDALRLGLPLAVAIAAMQVPALTHDYAAALLQVAKDGQRDIDQREASARQFYHLNSTLAIFGGWEWVIGLEETAKRGMR